MCFIRNQCDDANALDDLLSSVREKRRDLSQAVLSKEQELGLEHKESLLLRLIDEHQTKCGCDRLDNQN